MNLKKFFHFEELNTSYKQEIIAGLTTFLTMGYIIIVNPKILEAAGIPFGASITATILSAFFGTLAMGVYAKRPFAIAPYMGENAFIAFTVVKVLGYSWQTALGAIFIGGVLFTLLTIFKIRGWLANSIPESLKIGFAVGIGLFLTFIGLNETGIVVLGIEGAPVHVGNFYQPNILLSILGFVLIGFLMIKNVKGSILIGILSITFLSIIFGITKLPSQWIGMPPDISSTLFKLDISGALSWGFFAVILTVFVMDFVDTMGTLLGLSFKANLLDEKGNLPEIEKPMLCDALATVIGSLLGTTTTGTFIESATGIEAGGKTGFTAVVTSLLFLLTLFFAPLISIIPAFAYGPSLIIVGMLMISPIKKLNFNDISEILPVFTIIVLMSFTYNLGIGMTAGFALYVLVKILTGNIKEIKLGMWILSSLSILFFIFYPY
ncbi:MAG: guanine permease [Ignavibacteriales bacterium CG_4_9_14_3_um_filter_30_11]|nr:MAG: guanine permease [Ignavibacteriales bacterium CG_4_9_14_3_um_filter_30_11]